MHLTSCSTLSHTLTERVHGRDITKPRMVSAQPTTKTAPQSDAQIEMRKWQDRIRSANTIVTEPMPESTPARVTVKVDITLLLLPSHDCAPWHQSSPFLHTLLAS